MKHFDSCRLIGSISYLVAAISAIILILIPLKTSSILLAQNSNEIGISVSADSLSWPEINSEQKAWTRWWWMGNAVTKEGITDHLEKMAEANFGGVEISPIYGVEGYENASVEYLSPEWMSLLAHTVEEANRLDMKVDMITGTGWPFGGAHVTTEDAARRFVTKTYQVRGGENLPHQVQQVNRRNASKADLHILMGYSSEGDMIDLTEYVDDMDMLNWTPGANSGNWQLIALFNDWTTQQVKRAAPGEEGHVMDHFSDRALNNYLERYNSSFNNHDDGLIRAFFNDSYEVERANWTYDFFDQFENYRNYDLRKYLGYFLGYKQIQSNTDTGIPASELSKRIRADFHETIHDLALNRFVIPWVEWTHSKGSLSRNQAHGFPANILDIYGSADIPEMEIFGQSQFRIPGLRTNQVVSHRVDSPNPLILKFASSAAHVEGKSLVSSETATWLDEHFMVSLSQLRPHVDMQFISGINHTIYHGSTYSPSGETWPGWKFYASTHFAPSNTFWDDLGDFNRYLANSQAFLQKGNPANDILLYFPVHDLWHSDTREAGTPYFIRVHNPNQWFYGTNLGDTAEILWDRGYAFDYISDRQLQNVVTESGQLYTGNSSYKTILIPDVKHMPVETITNLLEIARAGGTVIFKEGLPVTVPGYHNFQERERLMENLLDELDFQSTEKISVFEAKIGEGRILKGSNSSYLLEYAAIKREKLVDSGLSYIRRSHDNGHYYFLSNLYGEELDEWLPISVEAEQIILFDPLTEKYGEAKIRSIRNKQPEVYIQLKPGESRILKTYQTKNMQLAGWEYYQPIGQTIPVEGNWQLSFKKGGPAIPGDIETGQLLSWTELGEDTRRFSGTAEYRITIRKPEQEADAWRLNLGRVAESASILLNGEHIGSVWGHPFEIDLTADLLTPGENELTIEVTNLMLNRIIDVDRQGVRWQKFYDINMVDINYQPFDASGWEPIESGLLGPVTIIPLKKLD